MKKLFLTLVALVVATLSYAQSTLVATLSHEENITMYYGTYALRDAVNAAVSGDVINLSGGAFQAVNITKGITLRGTGIDDAAPSYISGDFTINVATDDANRLSMEGIRCTGTIYMQGAFDNPYFLKCAFKAIYYIDVPAIKNAMIANCIVTNHVSIEGTCTMQILNCYIQEFFNYSDDAQASLINCVIRPDHYNQSQPEYIANSMLLNCIICTTFTNSNSNYNNGYHSALPSTSFAKNCISIGFENLFKNSQTNEGCTSASFEEVFKDFFGWNFELTDEAKTKYLGNDGTEVGMYGGMMPYTSTPSYPQITKMNVANKTTADGKLSVEIEVSAAE